MKIGTIDIVGLLPGDLQPADKPAMSGVLVQRLAELNLIRDPASAGTKTLVISRHRKATRRNNQYNIASDDVVLHRRGTLQRRCSTDGTTQNLGNIDVVLHRRGSLQRTLAATGWDQTDQKKATLLTTKYGRNSLNLQELRGLENIRVKHRDKYHKKVTISQPKMAAQVNGIVNNLHDVTSDASFLTSKGLNARLTNSISMEENLVNMNSDVDTSNPPNSLESDPQSISEDYYLGEDEAMETKDKSIEEDVSMRTDCDDNSICDSLVMDSSSVDDKSLSPPVRKKENVQNYVMDINNQEEILRNVAEAGRCFMASERLATNNAVNVQRTKSKKKSSFPFNDKNVGGAVKIGAAYKESRLRERNKEIVTPYQDDPSQEIENVEHNIYATKLPGKSNYFISGHFMVSEFPINKIAVPFGH